jgi:hypothetical protein
VAVRIFLAAVWIFSGASFACAAELPLKEKVSIYKTRPALLRGGWKPIETFTAGDIAPFAHSDGNAKPIYGHGFKEIESCTGIGPNYCTFNYRKGDRCLIVYTAGEYFPPRYPEVSNWWTYPGSAKGMPRNCSQDAAHKTVPKPGSHNIP